MRARRLAFGVVCLSSVVVGLWACESDGPGGGGSFGLDSGGAGFDSGSTSTFDSGSTPADGGTPADGAMPDAVGPIGCVVDGGSFANAQLDPTNPCNVCDVAVSKTAFSPAPDGKSCGAGLVCTAGTCTSGCFLDGGLAEAGALDPSNDCRSCAPATSTNNFTPRADGVACGAAQFCTGGACGPTWHGSSPGLLALYGGMAAAAPDGRLFYFGGYPSGAPGFSTATQIYNPATGAVTTGAAVPYTTYRGGAVTAPNGLIYVFGGSSGTNLVYAYDPVANTFTPRANMPVAIAEFGFTVGKDGKIYVFAITGTSPPWTTAHTLVYDPALNTWSNTAKPMPTPRQLAFAATLDDGRIMVVGGNTGAVNVDWSTVNEIYSPATDTWTTGAPIPQNFDYSQGGVRSDGRVMVGSGITYPSGVQTSAMFVYDPTADSWAPGTPTTVVHRLGYSARTPDGRLYVFGGRAAGGQNTAVVDALY